MYEPISCQNQAIIIRIRQELESGGGGHCLEMKRKQRSEKWASRETALQGYPGLILLGTERWCAPRPGV